MEKKSKIILTILLVIVIFSFNFQNTVMAEDNAKLNIDISSDTKDLKSQNKLYYNIGLYDVKNIDTSKPMALSATLEYNSNILSNPTISGASNWSAEINKNNNKMLIDCASFTPEQTIATISFDANLPKGATTTIKVALVNVEISGGDNYDVTVERIDSGTVTISTVDNTNLSSSTLPKTGEETSSSTTIVDKSNKTKNNNNTTNNIRGETVFNLVNNDKDSAETSTQKVNTIEPVKDATTSNSPIPQTGVGYGIIIAIVIIVVIGIYTFIRDKKFYD